MVQELFFEIMHKKQHIFCDAKDTAPVFELKKILEGILKVPASRQTLVKFTDDSSFDQYVALDDRKTLGECGFSAQNAKAQSPATIGLYFDGEHGPSIAELSSPPPIPDSMRNEHPQDN